MEDAIPLARPHTDASDVAAVTQAIESRWLTAGEETRQFEFEMAQRVGAKEAVAVANGTAALSLALEAAGIGRGDKVAVPSFTYLATVHVVALLGAEPIFIDVHPGTWNIDAASLAKQADARLKAVIAVDQFGVPADIPLLEQTLRERNSLAVVIDDAACALGARDQRGPLGKYGRYVCTSFHPRKVLTTGEGGMIFSEDASIAERLRLLRNHGRDAANQCRIVAGNQRMSEIACALGRSQLRRLDWLIERRAAAATRYTQRLAKHPALTLQQTPPSAARVWQTFAVCLPDEYSRMTVIQALAQQGVQSGPASYALHLEEPYRASTQRDGVTLPVTERLARQALALPLFPEITDAQIDRACHALESALEK